MKFVGLAGGIGSGKSTVGEQLARRGAEVIDVDAVSRELQEPGQPLYDRIVARWGDGVVAPDGRLDRAALAAIVFRDRAQLTELTSMAAPFNEEAIVQRASVCLGTDRVAVVETAMSLTSMYGMRGICLVDVAPDVAVERLVTHRGMSEDDARARVASQLPRELRIEHADFVIDNSRGLDALEVHVARAWQWIHELPDAIPTLPT
jgi:dephospho-CoA kinase